MSAKRKQARFVVAMIAIFSIFLAFLWSVVGTDLDSFLWQRFEPLNLTLWRTKKQDSVFTSSPSVPASKCFLFLHGSGSTPQQSWRDFFYESSKRDAVLWNKAHLVAPVLDEIPGFKNFDFSMVLAELNKKTESGPIKGNCKKWIVTGNSLGAWLAFLFAEKFPEKTESIVVINSVGLDREYPVVERVFENPTPASISFLHYSSFYKAPEIPFWFWVAVSEILKKETKPMPKEKSPFLLDSRLKNIEAPTLLIWGLADRAIPNLTEDFKKLMPGIKVIELAQCGHTPQVECFDQVKKEIEKFTGL